MCLVTPDTLVLFEKLNQETKKLGLVCLFQSKNLSLISIPSAFPTSCRLTWNQPRKHSKKLEQNNSSLPNCHNLILIRFLILKDKDGPNRTLCRAHEAVQQGLHQIGQEVYKAGQKR